MQLHDLAPESVARICEFAGSMAVIRFWLSGAPKLRQLLSIYGGVQIMTLEDNSRGSSSRWPSVVSELRGLRSLSVCSTKNDLIIPPEALKRLSKLRSLHLSCLCSGQLLRELDFGEQFPELQDLYVLLLKSDTPTSHIPKSLMRLSLGDLAHPGMFSGGAKALGLLKIADLCFSDDNGAMLEDCQPTELRTKIGFLVSGPRIPDSVTKLTFENYFVMTPKDHFLPPHLVELNFNVGINQSSLAARPLRMLNQLRKLRIKAPSGGRPNGPFFQDFLTTSFDDQPMFPHSLLSLDIDVFIEDYALILPPHLEELHISSNKCLHFCTELLDPHPLSMPSASPSSREGAILALKTGDLFRKYVAKYTERGTPKTLRSLITEERFGSTHSNSTIERLWKSLQGEIPLVTLSLLYPGLEKNCFDFFPVTLRHLEVGDCFPQSQYQLKRLHRLQTLRIRAPNLEIDSSVLFGLSPSISTLELYYIKGLKEADLAAIPSGTTRLSLTGNGHVPNNNLDPISIVGFRHIHRLKELRSLTLLLQLVDFQDWMISTLPRSLEVLHISHANTSVSFAYLPSCLQELKISSMESLKMSDLQYLPRGMRQLQIYSVWKEPSRVKDMPLIPLATFGMPTALVAADIGTFHWSTSMTQEEQKSQIEDLARQRIPLVSPAPLVPQPPQSIHERRNLNFEDALAPLTSITSKKPQ